MLLRVLRRCCIAMVGGMPGDEAVGPNRIGLVEVSDDGETTALRFSGGVRGLQIQIACPAGTGEKKASWPLAFFR